MFSRLSGVLVSPKRIFCFIIYWSLDVNGDMYIDPYELEAIFQAELDKVYDPNNPDVSDWFSCDDDNKSV